MVKNPSSPVILQCFVNLQKILISRSANFGLVSKNSPLFAVDEAIFFNEFYHGIGDGGFAERGNETYFLLVHEPVCSREAYLKRKRL